MYGIELIIWTQVLLSPEEGLGSPSWLSFVLGEMWEFPPWRVLLGSLGFTGIA